MKRRDFLKGLVGAGAAVAITAPSAKSGGDWIEIDCKDSGAYIVGVKFQWEEGTKPPMTMMEIYVEGDEDSDNEYHWACREGQAWYSSREELWFWIKCTRPPIDHTIKLRLHERLGTMDQIAFEPVPRDSYKVLVRKIPQSSELGSMRSWKDIFRHEIYFRWEEL